MATTMTMGESKEEYSRWPWMCDISENPLDLFMVSFRDGMCSAKPCPYYEYGHNEETRYQMLQKRESLFADSENYEQLDLLDPEKLFEEELRTAADLGGAGGDDSSCDSSISSTGENISSTDKVRVSFYPRLARAVPQEIDTISVDALGDEDDAASGKSEKSARFNESLNTFIEYAPTKLPAPLTIYEEDEEDYPDHQSVGGKVNVWKSNMHILDGHRFDYRVLGTSINDETTKPHVMTTSIMDALQDYLPFTKQGDLFWLKYSMVRDGSSMQTLLNKTRGSEYTIFAIETMEGEVFGAFTAQPWHVTWKYFGTPESFLWRLQSPRTEKPQTRAEKAMLESDLEVFPYAGNNRNIQLCNSNRLALGGGSPDDSDSVCNNDDLSHIKLTEWGFGLAFGGDLQQGTSSPCITFESPSLSKVHMDGTLFEVSNLEIWSLTPCINLYDAERLEDCKMAQIKRCMTV
jgi:hypothetical protein